LRVDSKTEMQHMSSDKDANAARQNPRGRCAFAQGTAEKGRLIGILIHEALLNAVTGEQLD
jgi:hypothetical protein